MQNPLRKISRYAKRASRALSAENIARMRSLPVQPYTVLYESFAGNGMLCNPEAIFRQLLNDPIYSRFTHVWALSDAAAIARFTREFADHPRVKLVRRESAAYWRELSTAGYLINNATFPPAFGKRSSQVYINTWHGTPLKRMGFDMPDGALQSPNTLRNFLMADFLLAANSFMAETMYEGAFRLDNIYQGSIIEEGYPRVDRQFIGEDLARSTRRELGTAGISVGDQRIVIYAPTWRGESFANPEADLSELLDHLRRMQSSAPDDTVVLLKAHQAVHALAAQSDALRSLLVPNTIPTNVLLGLSAALITDYSSIFFDYLQTGRPIVFFTPDADGYTDARGTYLPLEELPGTVTDNPEAAMSAVQESWNRSSPNPRYQTWAERFTSHEDGNAASRVIDIVFAGNSDRYRVRHTARDGRKRLLIHLGGMKPNGITSSALNLLEQLDHDRYDVTAITPYAKPESARANQALIDPRIRQMARQGGMNGSKFFHLQRRALDLLNATQLPGDTLWHNKLWRDEWMRVMGSATFDWVADFSGYSPIWANLLLQSPAAPRAIWLHSEMASDRLRKVNGRHPLKRGLSVVFQLYRGYDQLVSVSERLTSVNRRELAEFAPQDRFFTVRNFPSQTSVPRPESTVFEVLEPGETPPDWMHEIAAPGRNTKWFITVGRLSPEKNHARLIRAFQQLHATHPETRLLIVGDGPCERAISEQIVEAHLESAVFLAGRRSNPTPLLSASDCFVLSSDYEGQPMVFIEAALCGLPIVSTGFASVAGSLPGDTIHVVALSDEALRDGMSAYLNGQISPSMLNLEEYVSAVQEELERLIG